MPPLTHKLERPVKPERLVVIGAAGFVGAHVASAARSEGIDVLALSRADVDLSSTEAYMQLSRLFRPSDTVVFAAARAPAKTSEMMVENIVMAQAVCAAWRQSPAAHLIYISSDAVYGEATFVTETSPTDASSIHGAMHVAREAMLQSVAGASPLAILRPTALYGAGDPHNSYGPNRFARDAVKTGAISLFGNGEEMRDHVHVEDLAKVVLGCAANRSSGILNVALGQALSFRAVAEHLASRLAPAPTIHGSPRQNPVTHRHFDPTLRLTRMPEVTLRSFEQGSSDLLRADVSVTGERTK
jgi:UDP-glucose 4-epimerase